MVCKGLIANVLIDEAAPMPASRDHEHQPAAKANRQRAFRWTVPGLQPTRSHKRLRFFLSRNRDVFQSMLITVDSPSAATALSARRYP